MREKARSGIHEVPAILSIPMDSFFKRGGRFLLVVIESERIKGGIDQLRIENECFQTLRQPEYDGKRWNSTQDGGVRFGVCFRVREYDRSTEVKF
jgi:hypothetical protein